MLFKAVYGPCYTVQAMFFFKNGCGNTIFYGTKFIYVLDQAMGKMDIFLEQSA